VKDPRASVKEIFEKYHEKVFRLAVGIVRNEQDAKDITQNTFLKVINSLKGFRNESSISTWIYRIAYNESLMYLRARSRRQKAYTSAQDLEVRSDGSLAGWPKLPDKALLERELRKRVEGALSLLPIQYRIPFILHHTQDMPLKEIAEVLNIKVNSLKTRLHRAHAMIASEIRDYYKDKRQHISKEEPTCGLWTRFVYQYARQSLEADKLAGFNRHIADCEECASFLQSYARALRISESLECGDIPARLKQKISQFILEKIS